MEPTKADLHPHLLVGVVPEFTGGCTRVYCIQHGVLIISSSPPINVKKLDNTKWEIGIEISTPELIIHHG
jgi:hypothetical protein